MKDVLNPESHKLLVLLLMLHLCFSCTNTEKQPADSKTFVSDNDLFYMEVKQPEATISSGTAQGDSMFTFQNYDIRDVLRLLSEDKIVRFNADSSGLETIDLTFEGHEVHYNWS